MQRRKFIQLLSLTSVGTSIGFDLFAKNSFEQANIIAIEKVNLHTRHGFLNLQDQKSQAFSVQRDVLLRDGFNEIKKDRMTSIKVNSGTESFYTVLSPNKVQTDTQAFEIIELEANEKIQIKATKNAVIFSEYEDFTINQSKIKSDACYKVNNASLLNIVSNHDQYLLVFKS